MCIYIYILRIRIYQYGPTGSVDREFVDIVREKKRKREREGGSDDEKVKSSFC